MFVLFFWVFCEAHPAVCSKSSVFRRPHTGLRDLPAVAAPLRFGQDTKPPGFTRPSGLNHRYLNNFIFQKRAFGLILHRQQNLHNTTTNYL